jgi:hypothetical protein
MARIEPIEYQGPKREFIPTKGDMVPAPETPAFNSITSNGGYHDLEYLLGLLDGLINDSSLTYNRCDDILQGYALIIDQENTDLINAQNIAYPSDSNPPMSISFEEYKYLLINNTNNASQYILSSYEDSIRGMSGINALDISHIALIINNEAKRIKDFIDEYIGELDDSAEFRTVELFQDWAEESSGTLKRFWQALTSEISVGLAESELDQVTSETAPQFQTIFQVKLNLINKNIKDTLSQLIKNWESTSLMFYSKNLGPALNFQLKVGRNLFGKLDTRNMPVLANEANAAISGLNSNFSVALTDQLKRNQIFFNYCQTILLNVMDRDRYFAYGKQLASVGKPLKNIFTESSSISESLDIVNSVNPLTVIDNEKDFNLNFDHPHSELTGLTADDAHPQYLLKSGGEVSGDITFASGVKIAGMDLKLHRHDGVDSVKIRGSDIDENSISETNIDTTNSSTSIPEGLRVVSQSSTLVPFGLTKVVVRVAFEMEVSDNVVNYEFEITKL